MNGKTYYAVLGVSPVESPGGIRAAYRDLAKKLHPDVAGQQATHAFQELGEAYDVLSDPQRRRAYGSELRRADSSGVTPIPPAPAAPVARAFVSLFGSRAFVRRPGDVRAISPPLHGRRDPQVRASRRPEHRGRADARGSAPGLRAAGRCTCLRRCRIVAAPDATGCFRACPAGNGG
jgi:curved DNA-binding protein CbpA